MRSTERTLMRIRKEGGTCDVCERFISQAGPFGIRKDLFQFIDIIRLDSGITAIQACSGSGVNIRKSNIVSNPNAKRWLEAGGKIEIWGWRKLKYKRGSKAIRWEPRIVEIKIDDMKGTSE